jgi:hypothetical protein
MFIYFEFRKGNFLLKEGRQDKMVIPQCMDNAYPLMSEYSGARLIAANLHSFDSVANIDTCDLIAR